MTLRSRSPQCEGHSSFWFLCPDHGTDFHQTWNNTCVEHGIFFCDLEVKGISKAKGHFSCWLLCLYLWTTFQQTWYRISLEYGHDHVEVKVIPRSKLETMNTSEWLAILLVLNLGMRWGRVSVRVNYFGVVLSSIMQDCFKWKCICSSISSVADNEPGIWCWAYCEKKNICFFLHVYVIFL